MIAERGVSYYGVMQLDRVARDLDEMMEKGCNAVLMAISEFDWWFWRKSVTKMTKLTRDFGLKAYVDLWGWGKTFAGEPPSLILQQSLSGRQVSASGKTYNAMCMNHEPFREYLTNNIDEMLSQVEIDGFFWDEPHYANWYSEDWACRCDVCRATFKKKHGFEMPTALMNEVIGFREDMALDFLTFLSHHVKKHGNHIKIVTCVLPTESPLIGITEWKKVASMPHLDVFATDPYWFRIKSDEGLKFFKEKSEKAVKLARDHNKSVQVWVQAFKVPKGRELEIREAVNIADSLNVDSIFAWTYRGGVGSILESDDWDKVWGTLGEAYKQVSEHQP